MSALTTLVSPALIPSPDNTNGLLMVAAAAATEATGVDPYITLALGLMTLLGLTIAPIAVAWINRGGKAKPIDIGSLPPDVVMPRKQYDELLDQFARADDENERLHKENRRLREQMDRERVDHALMLARLGEK